MTTMAGASGGGALVATLAAGVVLVGALLASQVSTALDATLDAQPIPPQPTVVIPPPQAQAVNWGGPSELVLGFGTVMLADVGTMEWPEGGDVVITDHPQIKHGEDVANKVRAFMAAYIAAHPLFGKQPPCDDGRYRFMAEMEPGVWAVWVLEEIGAKLYQEKTAFTGTQEYVNSVQDKCGKKNAAWWGHAYAQ